MIRWYHNMNVWQKLLCFGFSILMLPFYIGLGMLALLLYCALADKPT